MTELAGIYRDTRGRIGELVGALDDEGLATPVPACPSWTVRDVVAHVAANASDVLAGRLTGPPSDEFTADQVAARRHLSMTELLATWADDSRGIEDLMRQLGRPMAILVADLVTHEHDIRGALSDADARDTEAVRLALDLGLEGLGARVSDAGLPALRVRADGSEEVCGPGEPAVHLEAPAYELWRALFGRRTDDQIRAYEWQGDPAPYLPLFSGLPKPVQAVVE